MVVFYGLDGFLRADAVAGRQAFSPRGSWAAEEGSGLSYYAWGSVEQGKLSAGAVDLAFFGLSKLSAES